MLLWLLIELNLLCFCMYRVQKFCIDISFPALGAQASTLIHTSHLQYQESQVYSTYSPSMIQMEHSDSFQLISIEEIDELQQSALRSPTPSHKANFLAYPSLNKDIAARQPTLQISISNEFQDPFIYPIRKQSLKLQGWLQEEQQKSVEEISPEELVEQQQSLSDLSSEQCNLLSTSLNFNTSIFTDRRDYLYQGKEQKNDKEQLCHQSTDEIEKGTVALVIKPKEITVVQKQGYFYWSQDFTVEINLTTLSQLYDEMFSRECFIPIFSQRIFTDWMSLSSKQRESRQSQAYKTLKGYLERYTEFMNHQDIFRSFLSVLAKINETKEHRTNNQIFCQPASSIINYDFKSIIQTFKKLISTEKSQILRKTIFYKIQSLQSSRKHCEKYSLTRQVKRLKEAESYYWKILSNIYLLQSLEATQEYCSKRCEGITESKIRQFWIKYKTSIRQSIHQLYATTLYSIQI